ncbi:hypothetical protein ACTL32_18830, partial [Planococcus sp. FY231025]|uniref:hypothetical protein n=1 Tax=Planococcus sp. FY231025 TaxID=3455699 RepID=UPI003F927AA3
SRSRASALVTSFVDVLLFSFQGSCCLPFSYGDFSILSASQEEVNNKIHLLFQPYLPLKTRHQLV